MSVIGNSPTNQAYVPATDYFSGNGSTTSFTLSRAVATVNDIVVVVENVVQNPGTAYTVSGNTLTFTGTPPSGTNNIWVRYTSLVVQQIKPAQQTVGLTELSASGTPDSTKFLRGDNSWQVVAVTPTAVSSQANTATDYFALPSGTTAQRPASPVNGMIRNNTTTNKLEVYQNGEWAVYAQVYSVDYLIVAGGGGGGGRAGGGGGAGGYLASAFSAVSGTSYTIVVGGGGAGGAPDNYGSSGANSSAFGITSTGGGGAPGGVNYQNGLSGGSGGSGAYGGSGGSGTSGQGNAGGGSYQSNYNNGGGGGANAAGESGTSSYIGSGGAGKQWLNGSYYAGGGGGGGHTPNPNQGYGGLGGGGNGGTYNTWSDGFPGTANTGGGGGGATSQGSGTNSGGAGGSGVVIIRYAGAQKATGGTVTSSGGYTYHTFTSSGTFTA